MSDDNDGAAAPSRDGGKKPYARPTLTEYGSVAKLTMLKGTTQSEISPNKKKACL
ncbi:MAG: hypothetical protein JWL71_1397 [Acidobacteria bacterium]|nr:hypothetical protein [Acidobacteriota bacterium]